MQNWKGLDIDKKRGGAAIIEALGSKEMAKYSWIFGKYSWIDEYWEHILGNLDIWKKILGWRQNNLGCLDGYGNICHGQRCRQSAHFVFYV